MNLFLTFKVALRALGRNKLRSSLTMLGIIIGVGAVIAMVGIGQGASSSIQSQIANLGDNMLFVMSVFQKLNKERGITIALVTHEPDIAQYARRVVVFKDGRVKSDEMIKNPRSAREELESMPALEDEEDEDE